MSGLTVGQAAAVDAYGKTLAETVARRVIAGNRAAVVADLDRASEVMKAETKRAADLACDAIFAGADADRAFAVAADVSVWAVLAILGREVAA